VPLGTLVVGDAVLGSEIRDGTFQLTWLAPVRLPTIVLGRWVAGSALAAVVVGLPLALSAPLAGSAVNTGPVVVAGVAATTTYVAVFMLIGASVRRGTLWSLTLVYLLEQLLGAVLSGVAQYSPQWLGRSILGDLGTGTEDLLREGVPTGGAAFLRLALVTVVALALTTWRLRHFSPTGGRD
jgi:ABC-type transport system involved in multi-copper enzyme maturation permease subunit